jgi:hypothetical protein
MNQFKQLEWLLLNGYVLAVRDPKVNELFPGRFQVTDPRDGEGGFALVSDDLSDLVHQAYSCARHP